MSSYATALRTLRAGEIVGVFPEATISRSFEIKDIKSGAVRMVAAGKAPIVPVAVWGGQRLWTKNHPRKLVRGQTVLIIVGEPFTVGTRDDMDAATELLRTTLQALVDRAAGRAPVPGRPGPHAGGCPRTSAARRPRPSRPPRPTPPRAGPGALRAVRRTSPADRVTRVRPGR